MKKGGGSGSTIIIGPSKSPLFRIRPRPCPISGVRAKIIIMNNGYGRGMYNTLVRRKPHVEKRCSRVIFHHISCKMVFSTLLQVF